MIRKLLHDVLVTITQAVRIAASRSDASDPMAAAHLRPPQ